MSADTSTVLPVEAASTEISAPPIQAVVSSLQAPETTPTTQDPVNASAGPSQPKTVPISPARSTRHTANKARAVPATAEPSVMPDASTGNTQPEYLQPSEFYPLNNYSSSLHPPYFPGQYLSPEDDKLATRGIPIFRPTIEDFVDFEAYVTRTVPWGQYSGIVKIIPPSEWSEALPPITKQSLADVRIKSPIQQNMLGQAGLFRATNVEKNKNRPLSIKEWYEKTRDKRWVGPGPKDVDVTRDRDSAAAKEKRREGEEKRKKEREAAKEKRVKAAERKEARKRAALQNGDQHAEGQEEHDEACLEELEFNGAHGGHADAEKNGESSGPTELHGDTAMADVPALDPSTHHSPHSSQSSASAKTPDSTSPTLEPFYQTFDPATAWLPPNTSAADYTPEACAQMERKFWKTMGLGEPGWYGADLQGSLFPDPNTPWNVANLPNLLNRLGRELPGVNRPYLYFGMWRAAFAWHVEDMDLFSINYIHFGAPKFWYAIPQGQAEQFERTITGYFPREAAECDQFLRHKSYVMSPTRLAKDGIHVNMLVHNQGEFVITYPRGYHAGFNMGFNCAESVNFALDSWVELGRRAKVCACVSHSVRIDMDELLGDVKLQEARHRIQTEQDLINAFEEERAGRGRKRVNANHAERPRKRVKAEASIIGEDDDPLDVISRAPIVPVRDMEKKKKVIPLEKEKKPRAAIMKQPASLPCVLCVSESLEALLEVASPADFVRNMCKSRDGVVRAHEACVVSVPEVWIEEDGGKPWVMGVNGINKARWGLKCQSCQDKKLAAYGAKVQCVNGKCPRAFHVTCARDDEQVVHRVWEIEEYVPVPIPEDAPEGTQHEFIKEKTLKTEILCPTHNPEIKELKKAQAANQLKSKILSILPGQSAKVKSYRGLFEVKLVRVFESDQKAEVQHENGQLSIVKWTDFDFRPAVEHKPLENEYARVHTHTRKPDGSSVPIQPPAAQPAPPRQLKPSQQKPTPPVHRHPKQPSQPLSVQQMLNPTPAAIAPHDYRHIPSRVVVCDSDGQPVHPAYPPPSSFLTHGQPLYHPTARGMPHSVHATPAQYGYPTGHPAHGLHGQHSYAPHLHAGSNQHMYASSNTYVNSQGYYRSPGVSAGNGYANGHPIRHPQIDMYSMNSQQWPAQVQGSSGAGRASVAGHIHQTSMPSPYVPVLESSSMGQASKSAEHSTSSIPIASDPGRSSGVGKIDLGLQRMTQLMKLLTPIRIPAIHLAGTNGKGSVSAMLESILRCAGFNTARYNSPHLLEPRDAIALNGEPPSTEEYHTVLAHVQAISQHNNIQATTFEIATATAFEIISRFGPDVMIIECGMGGIGDATNIIPPHLILASGLTSVGLDHTAFLGDTLEDITSKKAGIAVEDGLMVIGPQLYNGVARMAMETAQANGARTVFADRAMDLTGKKAVLDLERSNLLPTRSIRVQTFTGGIECELGLAGDCQLDNAALAINIITAVRADNRAVGILPRLNEMSDRAIVAGVRETRWKGRCELLRYPNAHTAGSMPVLVDGAHNADSARTLRKYIDSLSIAPTKLSVPRSTSTSSSAATSKTQKESDPAQITWILGLSDSKGKTIESVLEPMIRPGDRVICVPFSKVEGMPWVVPVDPAVVASAAGKLSGGQADVRNNVEEGLASIQSLETAQRGLVVVAGSLYLVADFYRLLSVQ